MTDRFDDLQERGHEAMKGLPREPVPEGLTDSILEAVAVPPPSRHTWLPRVLQAAAVAVLALGVGYGVGYGAGSSNALSAMPGRSELPPEGASAIDVFLVILHGPTESEDPVSSEASSWRRRQYDQWEEGMRSTGKLVGGGGLDLEEQGRGFWSRPGTGSPDNWFSGDWAEPSRAYILRAWSEDEAEVLARQSPHLEFGGSITIRRLDAD